MNCQKNWEGEIMNLTVDPIILTGWGTFAMAIVTFFGVIVTVTSTIVTHRHNKKVDEHSEQTLEVMRKAYEPALSLDLWRKEKKVLSANGKKTHPNYGITVRNDGTGPAKNVKFYYRFYVERRELGETSWRESENDLELGGPIFDIGNIAPSREWEWRLNTIKEDVYAVHLEASCEDVFGKKNYELKRKIHLEDTEER